jgi:hypothetical protein
MSNKVSKIRESAESDRKLKEYTLYGSLVGSCIVTVGKLSGKTENDMISDFARFSKDEELAKSKNITEVVDYIIKDFKMPEEYKKYIVLCYDEKNRYTPIVTLVDEEGYVQPLDRDGNYLGVLAQEDFELEYIYDDKETE